MPPLNSIINKTLAIPSIWNFLQVLIGANQWKQKLYPAVIVGGGKLLDFGCSVGNITPVFTDFDYYGIDTDPKRIQVAQRTFWSAKNVHFSCANILKEPLENDAFDHVLFACTGHHLADDELQKILEKLYLTLRQGGELHYFDSLSQPHKDNIITKFFIRADRGKYIRTMEEHEKILSLHTSSIQQKKIFKSPWRLCIKLPDLLYIRLKRHE